MKTIIFDFDGVILDSFDIALNIIQKLHREHSIPQITREKFQDLFEGNVWERYEELGVKGKTKELFLSVLKEELITRNEEMSFFEGIKECIQSLSKKNNLVIITSSHADLVKHLLELEDIHAAFEDIIGAETPGNKKDKIQKYVAQHNLKWQDVYFVTDTIGDIKEVEELPIHTIAVTWGFHSADRLKTSNADALIHSPQKLQTYLS